MYAKVGKKEETYMQTVIKKSKSKEVTALVNDVSLIIDNATMKVNWEKLKMYWNIGKRVNDYRIENNSKWGDGVILEASRELSMKYGRGYSKRSINRMRLFNKRFEIASSETQTKNKILLIGQALAQTNKRILIGSTQTQSISWYHYVELLSLNNDEIIYYLNEISKNKWHIKYLIEQKKKKSFQRLICNQKENSIKKIEKSLKDPTFLPVKSVKSEKDLEHEIITNLDMFMQELGSDYTYRGRQQKIIINNATYRVDLVFYNTFLKCFVLFDLKVGKVKRNDIAQMDMYINYYNEHELREFDNKTIGVILTTDKNLDIENYLNSDENLYQIKYLTKMPNFKELEKIINENKIILLKAENFKLK